MPTRIYRNLYRFKRPEDGAVTSGYGHVATNGKEQHIYITDRSSGRLYRCTEAEVEVIASKRKEDGSPSIECIELK